MFQKTVKILQKSTLPVVLAWREKSGKLNYGIGTCVLVNAEGWILTAAHIVQQFDDIKRVVDEPTKAKKRGRNPKQPTHYAYFWGLPKAHPVQAVANKELDIGAVKLENFDIPDGIEVAKLRRSSVDVGELLCRVGFPFVNDVRPTWTREKGFQFENLFPVPMFMNEALVSRLGQLKSGLVIETSSPGLRGQSGGPLADTEGTICGIQTSTAHYPLEFGGRGRDQVFNVGRAVHIDSIRRFLDSHKINYTIN